MKLYLPLLILVCVLASCIKADHNSNLGGNWQLSERVYFSIYTDMAQWRDTQTGTTLMGCFRHSGDSLVLTLSDHQTRGMYMNDGSNDVPVTDAAQMPAQFCIPANFGYRIVKNTYSELQLQSGSQVLTFKRY